jgi:hypothetical protein
VSQPPLTGPRVEVVPDHPTPTDMVERARDGLRQTDLKIPLRSLRAAPLPPTWVELLPQAAEQWLSPLKSSIPDSRRSISWLRRHLTRCNEESVAALRTSSPHHPATRVSSAEPKPSAMDAEGMVRVWWQAMQQSVNSSQYSADLSQHEAPVSALRSDRFWALHQQGCINCANRGSWTVARISNQDNPCYFKHVKPLRFRTRLLKSSPDPPVGKHPLTPRASTTSPTCFRRLIYITCSYMYIRLFVTYNNLYLPTSPNPKSTFKTLLLLLLFSEGLHFGCIIIEGFIIIDDECC